MKRGAEKITRRCLLFAMSAGLLLAQNPASEVRAMENVMESEDLTEDLIGSGTEFEGLLWNDMEDAGVLEISLEAETMTENAAVRSGNTISKDKVTFKTNGDYTHSIYANGMPLIIDATKADNYAEIYVDLNENGVAEAGEELTDLRGDGKRTGIFYLDGYGYFLSNSSIYGGAENGEYTYDTKITMNGSANPGGGVLLYMRFSEAANREH